MNEVAQNMVLTFPEPIPLNGGKVEARGPGGKRIQLALTPADVHTTQELATYLAGYKNFAYRADDISPIVQVPHSKFYYRTFDSDDAFLHVDTEIGPTSEPHLIDPKSAVATGHTVNHSVGSLVPVQTEEQGSFSTKMVAGKRCMNAIQLNREKKVMDMAGTNTNWAAGVRHTVGPTENWDGGADSDPIKKLQEAIQASMQEVTAIAWNRKVSDAFLRHDKVRDHMRQFFGDQRPPAAGRTSDYEIPGFPPFKVVSSKIRTTSGGTLSYTLGNHAVLLTQPPGVPDDGEEISTSYTYREKGEDAVGINVREWFVEGAGIKGAHMVAVSVAEIPIMTGPACGGHIASVVS